MGSCYIFMLIAFYFVTLATAGIMGDECDWTGSGLTSGTSREVTPVYLRCKAGKITWLYPRGALRVLLRLQNSNKDFRVCVRILSPSEDDDQEPDLYSEDRVLDFREFKRKPQDDFKKEWRVNEDDFDDDFPFVIEKKERAPKNKTKDEDFPARLFLEGSRGLLPLYSPDDGRNSRVRCFKSKGGQAAVYVEATPSAGDAPRRPARLMYDLQALPAHSYDPAAEECRPCTDQEMANAFCNSDLVTRGIIVGMRQRPELDSSELTVRVTRLVRYSGPGGRTYQAGPENSVGPTAEEADNVWYARVHAGSGCGVAAGAGEFLISARRRLGGLSLACAPRLAQWAKVMEKGNKRETAQCQLTS